MPHDPDNWEGAMPEASPKRSEDAPSPEPPEPDTPASRKELSRLRKQTAKAVKRLNAAIKKRGEPGITPAPAPVPEPQKRPRNDFIGGLLEGCRKRT